MLLVAILGAGLVALAAQPAAAGAMRVAIMPFETLGTESRASKEAQRAVAKAMATVPDTSVIASRDVRRALKKEPRLRACDGEPACLAELGKAVDATHVVFGEIGGLGDVEVVYLKLVDAGSGKEIRSITADLGGARARAAAFQLLAPERYVGTLALAVDVDGASIYVDGSRVATSPTRPVTLSVGPHAVRVTHPEFRDFVRFVDIEFGKESELAVSLQQYAVVASDLAHAPGKPLAGASSRQVDDPTPWYRTWYGVAGLGAGVLVTSALVAALLSGGIDADATLVVEPP